MNEPHACHSLAVRWGPTTETAPAARVNVRNSGAYKEKEAP